MANREKIDLLLHPARLAILEALAQRPMTTHELSDALPDVPQPSLYRHLKILLEAGMISISETRPVRGLLERVYTLQSSIHMDPDDVAGLSKAEHLHYFITYTAGLLQGFANYLSRASEPIDFLGDQVGFNEFTFNANSEEMEEFHRTLQSALQKLAGLPQGENRSRRKFALISFPLPRKENAHDRPD